MLKECLDQVRKKAPVVHNITNYVTVNDVANVILACGGRCSGHYIYMWRAEH